MKKEASLGKKVGERASKEVPPRKERTIAGLAKGETLSGEGGGKKRIFGKKNSTKGGPKGGQEKRGLEVGEKKASG